MLRAILNKSWRQHPTKKQLYSHLPLITKTIQVRRTRHAGHCWRRRDEQISDVLLWTHSHGQEKAWRPARTYIQQLSADTGCSPEDLPEAMDDREGWRERVREIRADGMMMMIYKIEVGLKLDFLKRWWFVYHSNWSKIYFKHFGWLEFLRFWIWSLGFFVTNQILSTVNLKETER